MKNQKFKIYSLIMLGSIFIGNNIVTYSEEGNNLYLRTGIGIFSGYSKFEPKISGEKQKLTDGKPDRPEYELGLEFTKDINTNIELGFGLAYQNNSSLKKYTTKEYTSKMGKYDSIPLYLVGKYKFDSFDNGIIPYLKANLGYSFNFNEKDGKGTVGKEKVKYKVDVNNGLYLGFGAGMEYNNFIVDLMYQVNGGKAYVKEKETGIKSGKDYFSNGKITLGIGYKFSY
ncbi:hypothetical protein FV113G1_11590 [Fusobacterium varium]|nr:hypothetical protein FV113G1_11590 [Fusobacterium varium]